jgi:hypothetical protein
MNWDAIGAVGELVGAGAVVATLFYLAVQVRQSNGLARRSEMNTGQDQISRWRMALASNRQLAEVFANGLTERGSLDEVDQARFDAMLGEVVWSGYHVWDRARVGLLRDDEWQGFGQSIATLLASSGGSVWWEESWHMFNGEYRKAVEAASSDLH